MPAILVSVPITVNLVLSASVVLCKDDVFQIHRCASVARTSCEEVASVSRHPGHMTATCSVRSLFRRVSSHLCFSPSAKVPPRSTDTDVRKRLCKRHDNFVRRAAIRSDADVWEVNKRCCNVTSD